MFKMIKNFKTKIIILFKIKNRIKKMNYIMIKIIIGINLFRCNSFKMNNLKKKSTQHNHTEN